jgi:probable rRNA maturation factor
LSATEKRALTSSLTTKKLAAIVDAALSELRLTGYDVELSFIRDPAMRKLNKAQRGKDKATDVLSFPMYEAKHGRIKLSRWEKALPNRTLGSIVIAMGVARRQAVEYEHSLAKELTRLIVHGVCHLSGYDHELSAREEKLMFAVEDRILARITRARP